MTWHQQRPRLNTLQRHIQPLICSLLLPVCNTHTHTHTQPFNGPLSWTTQVTRILIIRHPLSTSSLYYDPQHPPCSIYMLDSLFHLSPGPLWYSPWSGTLYFILHTYLHPIIILFLQRMPILSQPVLL